LLNYFAEVTILVHAIGNHLMLELQRQKYASRVNPGIAFARSVVCAHLGFGLLAPVLMLFHERFLMSVILALWYLLSLGFVVGMKNHFQWCRVLLGLWFSLATTAALFYLLWIMPSIEPASPPVLSLKIMPFWLSLWSLLYAAGALLVLMSRRIERATMRGFDLW